MATTSSIGAAAGPPTVESESLIAAVAGFSQAGRKSRFGPNHLAIFDFGLVWLSAGIAHAFVVAAVGTTDNGNAASRVTLASLAALQLFSAFVTLFASSEGLYSRVWQMRADEEAKLLAKCITAASLLLAAPIYVGTLRIDSVETAGLTAVVSWAMMMVWRRFLHSQDIPGFSEKKNALIVGRGRTAVQLRKHLDENREFGYVIKGFINQRNDIRTDGEPAAPDLFLGNVEDIPRIIREHFIDEIFICVPSSPRLVAEIARYTRDFRIQLRVVPDLYYGVPMGMPIEYLGGLPSFTLREASIPTRGLIFKRCEDMVVSLIALIALLPVLLLVALLIELDSRGPVLYAALRVGKKGQTFRCYKFRTMVANANEIKDSMRHLNERKSVTFKIKNDPRITRVGRVLRKYSLDELPQLWNVFLGQLSLVGPRPHPLDDFSRYELEHRRRLEVKPGITGLWQVTARRDPSFEKNVALDLEYAQKWSVWLDCRILWKTLAVVIAGTGE